MKKFLAIALAMMLTLSSASASTVFAADVTSAEPSVEEEISVTATNSTSNSGTMVGIQTVYSVPLYNVGTNPTFTFSISGNPDLYVNVVAVSPAGNEFTVFSNIQCNGASHSAYHFSLYSGTYYFTIRVASGGSSGQSKPFTISATW